MVLMAKKRREREREERGRMERRGEGRKGEERRGEERRDLLNEIPVLLISGLNTLRCSCY